MAQLKIVTEFNSNNLGRLRGLIEDALGKISAKHGLKIDLGQITYGKNEFTTRLIVATALCTDTSGNTVSKDQVDWTAACRMNPDLKPEWFGKSIQVKDETLVITGYDARARSKPVRVSIDGKDYRVSEDYAITCHDPVAHSTKIRHEWTSASPQHLSMYKMKPEYLDREFKSGGKAYKIAGIRLFGSGREGNFPIAAADAKGSITWFQTGVANLLDAA